LCVFTLSEAEEFEWLETEEYERVEEEEIDEMMKEELYKYQQYRGDLCSI